MESSDDGYRWIEVKASSRSEWTQLVALEVTVIAMPVGALKQMRLMCGCHLYVLEL